MDKTGGVETYVEAVTNIVFSADGKHWAGLVRHPVDREQAAIISDGKVVADYRDNERMQRDALDLAMDFPDFVRIVTKKGWAGMNFRTEGIQPLKWSYTDGRYIRSIQEQYGHCSLATYPNLTIPDMINFSLFKGIKTVPLLAYMNYSKKETRDILKREVDWTDYGGHHFESLYTRFVITDILWNKFRIDKRKVQLSAAVRSGKLNRYEALKSLEVPPSADPEITKIVLGKIGITEEEFREILSLPKKIFLDYPSSYPLIRTLRWPIKLACSLNLIPRIFYEKYLGAQG